MPPDNEPVKFEEIVMVGLIIAALLGAAFWGALITYLLIEG